jgi:hypothetical protein
VSDAVVKMLSPAWLSLLEESLKELVIANAAPDFEFSFCEMFTGAPPDVVGFRAGTAGYHYRIAGRSLVVSPGPMEEADVTVTMDYSAAVKETVTIYTPELMASRQRGDSPAFEFEVAGDLKNMPPWLGSIHNIMAERAMGMREASA